MERDVEGSGAIMLFAHEKNVPQPKSFRINVRTLCSVLSAGMAVALGMVKVVLYRPLLT